MSAPAQCMARVFYGPLGPDGYQYRRCSRVAVICQVWRRTLADGAGQVMEHHYYCRQHDERVAWPVGEAPATLISMRIAREPLHECIGPTPLGVADWQAAEEMTRPHPVR